MGTPLRACQCKAASYALQKFVCIVDGEIQRAFTELEKNMASYRALILRLKDQVNQIWNEAKNNGCVVREGLDTEWRPAFLTLHAIIEKAQAVALKTRQLKVAHCLILTARMSASLMLEEGKEFSEVCLGMPIAFAEIGRQAFEELLAAGGKVYSIYSSDACEILRSDKNHIEGLRNYQKLVEKFKNGLIDCPLISVPMQGFPLDKTGALYILDGNREAAIAIHSYQMSQSEKLTKTSSWTISIGTSARKRRKELDAFLKDHNAPGLTVKHLFPSEHHLYKLSHPEIKSN